MKKTIHLNSCKLCNSNSINEKYACRDHLVTGEVYPVMQCSKCGFIFTNDYPDENDIGSYYKSEKYISHSDRRTGAVDRLYHLARKIMLSRKYRIVRKYSGLKRGSLLDIGCGTGYFPAYMKSKDWDAEGIEKDKEARAFASEVNLVNVSGSEKLDNLEPGFYDCITLWHVLEHFHYPDQLLKQAAVALKDNGIMIIALPNNRSFDARHYGAAWAAWDVPRHLWHFSPGTMAVYLRKFGLVTEAVSRLPFDAFYVSILSEQTQGSKFSLLKGMFFGKISWLNSLAKRDETSSLAYIVKKSGN